MVEARRPACTTILGVMKLRFLVAYQTALQQTGEFLVLRKPSKSSFYSLAYETSGVSSCLINPASRPPRMVSQT